MYMCIMDTLIRRYIITCIRKWENVYTHTQIDKWDMLEDTCITITSMKSRGTSRN